MLTTDEVRDFGMRAPVASRSAAILLAEASFASTAWIIAPMSPRRIVRMLDRRLQCSHAELGPIIGRQPLPDESRRMIADWPRCSTMRAFIAKPLE